MKRILIMVSCLLCVILCGCDQAVPNQSAIDTGGTVSSSVTETEEKVKDEEKQEVGCRLLRSKKITNGIFYRYYTMSVAFDMEHDHCIPWNWISYEDEKHNEWIDTQTFNSLFTNGAWCLRTGYYNETGQWGVTRFINFGLASAGSGYHGMGQSGCYNIEYPDGDFWLVTPDAFGVPNDHSVEITSFDETKRTVTLTFTSPEGETTEVYVNYAEECRCDENGTPLLDENGHTFLYQFD